MDGFEGRGWTFPSHRIFDDRQVGRFLDTLRVSEGIRGSIARAKGILRTTAGWTIFELAGGQLHAGPSSYRRDSRFDLILKDGVPSDFERLDSLLSACLVAEEEPLLSLETETGQIATFNRRKLGEVARDGSGQVDLRTVLHSVGATTELPWLWLISERGLFGTGARREILERGRVVFGVDGEPIGEADGGPFRFEISDDEARGFEDEVDRCRTVPALCSLRLAEPPGSRTVPPLPLPKGFAESEGLEIGPETGDPIQT